MYQGYRIQVGPGPAQPAMARHWCCDIYVFRLPLLTSPGLGLPWAGPGDRDLTTHHATDCTSYPDSDPYATRAAVGRGTPATAFYGPPGPAGRGSY